MSAELADDHAARMDGVYRLQRHVYDVTRRYYLLGRDPMIAAMAVPPGAHVLELGCGTGRNIVRAAARYRHVDWYGLDISGAMLETAARAVDRAGLAARTTLRIADASRFDPQSLFGRTSFDRVFVSYALSMIPDWPAAIRAALDATAPGGSVHIADFGRQEGLPPLFARALHGWLARFHVTPRETLQTVLESECQRRGATLAYATPFRGYAVVASIRLPRVTAAAASPVPRPVSAACSPDPRA